MNRYVKDYIVKERISMKDEMDLTLSGTHNKRLNNVNAQNSNTTAALNDTKERLKDSNVSIPTEAGVINAKEWVDNGSRL